VNETTSNEKFYVDGLRFECTQCSNCCRHEPGYVFLAESDLVKIQKATGLSQPQALDTYCRRVNVGITERISLKEKENYDCIFWNDSGCEIYTQRPLQCRSYPFWSGIVMSKESWEREGKRCPGINNGKRFSRKSIDKWLEIRERSRFMS
jgi:uncharacterized protein